MSSFTRSSQLVGKVGSLSATSRRKEAGGTHAAGSLRTSRPSDAHALGSAAQVSGGREPAARGELCVARAEITTATTISTPPPPH
ncbi:hypothetical protein AB1Y20_014337 [Prymnesium parvum]|uniref:Uncharacterized protein n=1 Tax=Prymnesium parvum TaxID=97485 RepID=A0AB34IFY7_PRYPA